MLNDLRFAFRQLLKNRSFSAVAVVTLALGIGANTAIFTVVNALLLRSLPVTNPEELVQVLTRSGSSEANSFSYPFYKMLRDDGHSLSGLFAAGGVGERDQLIVPGDFVQRIEPKQRTALYKELLSRVEALPGVQAASLYGFGLLSGNGWSDRVLAEGYVATPDEDLTCQGMWVGPKFFETLGIKILSGRDFTLQDDRTASATNVTTPQVAVINEAMARRYFGDVIPLGRRFYFPGRPERRFEIVGVVKDAKYHSLRRESPPTFYVPFFQDSGQGMTVAAKVDPMVALRCE